MALSKIVVMGSGAVGASVAAIIAQKSLGSIFLYDIADGLAAGKAMDINQASPSLHTDCRVTGSSSPDTLIGSDIIVFTAGSARHAGMDRLDLLKKNMDVARQAGMHIMEFCPRAYVLVVTNPVEVITWYLRNTWPDMNAFGLGCSLDTVRFVYFIAEALGVSAEQVNGLVVGAHTDDMIPLANHASVGGIPLPSMVDRNTIDTIIRRTRVAGTTIVQNLKQHSGFYAASHVIARIVESIVLDRSAIFPVSVPCAGEYGFRDIVLALPVIVCREGVNQIVEMDLDSHERALLEVCASSMAHIIRDIRDEGSSYIDIGNELPQ